MRIVLSHSYNKENRYFLVEKKDEPLEKIFLRLAALLTMIFHLNSNFDLEEEEISRLLKNKFNFTCDFKSYEYNELWKKHKIIDVNYFEFYNLLKEQSDENIYHVDLESYNLQLQELEENVREFDIKNWFSFLK